MTKISDKSGFSLLEVVIAVSIVAIVGVAGLAALFTLVKSSENALRQVQATALLTEGIEAVKSLRDDSWGENIATLNLGSEYQLGFETDHWEATTTQVSLLENFYRTIKVESVARDLSGDVVLSGGTIDPNIVLLTVSVSWPPSTQTATRTIQTYVANVFEN